MTSIVLTGGMIGKSESAYWLVVVPLVGPVKRLKLESAERMAVQVAEYEQARMEGRFDGSLYGFKGVAIELSDPRMCISLGVPGEGTVEAVANIPEIDLLDLSGKTNEDTVVEEQVEEASNIETSDIDLFAKAPLNVNDEPLIDRAGDSPSG